MNPLLIFILLILFLIIIQVVLYKLLGHIKHSKQVILGVYLILYFVVLPLLLLPGPGPPSGEDYHCGLVMVAIIFGRGIIAVLGLTFTLVTHSSYRAIMKRKQFRAQEQ